MFDRKRIRGIIPPLATPLTPDEKLDEHGLRQLIRKLLDAGCHGMFILGGTGEGIYLTDEVQARTIQATVEEVAGRVPVIAGVSDVSAGRAIVRGRQAAQLGADVLISVPPYQALMAPQEVEDYFIALAEGTSMPTMLYNVPPWVRTYMMVDTIARLAEHEGIIGMKDSDEFVHVASVALATKGTGFRLLCGTELNFVPGMMMGCVGGTLAAANIWPEIMVEAYDVCAASDWERAREMQETLMRFMEPLYVVPWTAGCKYALSLQGICSPTVMRPARTLTEDQKQSVRSWLTEYNLIQ